MLKRVKLGPALAPGGLCIHRSSGVIQSGEVASMRSLQQRVSGRRIKSTVGESSIPTPSPLSYSTLCHAHRHSTPPCLDIPANHQQLTLLPLPAPYPSTPSQPPQLGRTLMDMNNTQMRAHQHLLQPPKVRDTLHRFLVSPNHSLTCALAHRTGPYISSHLVSYLRLTQPARYQARFSRRSTDEREGVE